MDKQIICIATPLYPPDIGGPATHVALLEQELRPDQYELRVVAFSAVRSMPKIVRHVVYFLKVFFASRGVDFVYALDPVSVGFPALCAAKLRRKRFVLRVGGDYAWEQGTQRFGVEEVLDEFIKHRQPSALVRALQDVQSFVARHAALVIVPSEYLARIVSTWGVAPERLHVAYSQPELPPTSISRSEARKRLKLHENEEIIFSAGRLVPWKGMEGVVDAVKAARKNCSAKLYIAGSGPEQESLERHIAQQDAGKYVTLLGTISKDGMALWFAAADIFVLNTRYEGLSHTILEAFYAQTPVVTTPEGGNLELIENAVQGIIAPYNDIPALAESIVWLLHNRVFASDIAHRAHASLSRFNKDRSLTRIRELFASLKN